MGATDTLFDMAGTEMLSPMMAWRERHGIRTHHAPDVEEMPWLAWFGCEDPMVFAMRKSSETMGRGKTEDEAIGDLCEVHGIPLFGEEEVEGGRLRRRGHAQARPLRGLGVRGE